MVKKDALIISFSCALFMFIGGESRSAIPQDQDVRDTLGHEVNVVLKLVQVSVVDDKGNAVTDLSKEDFEIIDNGKRQSITDFERHVLSPSKEELPSTGMKDKTSSPKLNRKIFLFFDLAFNTEAGTRDAKKAALYFIDHQMNPADEVGVLSYSATKAFTVHENLTNNHKKVREVVERIGLNSTLGRAEDVEHEYWNSLEKFSSSGQSDSRVWSLERRIEEADFNDIKSSRILAKQQVAHFSRTMKEFGQALGHIRGHKLILYLSTGIPASFLGGADPDLGLNDRYGEMIKTLAASDSSVYPIYAQEMTAPDRQIRGKSSLQRLASGTGGKYFGTIKNYEAIMEEFQKTTSSFYMLGYPIGMSWDGAYHKIAVVVRREGCRVQAQTGYFNPKPFNKLSAFEKRLEILDLALEERAQFSTPLRFPVVSLFYPEKGMSGMITLAKVPAEAVQALSGRQVEFVHLLFDEKDDLKHLKVWRIDFTKLPLKDVTFYSLLSLAPGRYTSRIVLRNTKTGRSAVSSAQAVIPPPQDAGLALSSPLLLVPEESPAYLKGELIELRDADKTKIDLADAYPMNFNRYAPLVGEMKRGAARLIAVIRYSTPDGPSPNLRLSPSLRDSSTGVLIPAPFSISFREAENHVRIAYLDFQTERLQEGKYEIRIEAEEPLTGFKSEAGASFWVK